MDCVTHNVAEIGSADRHALEHLVGQPLREDQQVVIHIVNVDVHPAVESGTPSTGKLPEWCNVYEGLSDQQVAELEQIVLTRADLSRTID